MSTDYKVVAEWIITGAAPIHDADELAPVKRLCGLGTWAEKGNRYSVSRDGSRYVATIDETHGHGFYKAPTLFDAVEWIMRRINPAIAIRFEPMKKHRDDRAGHSRSSADCTFCDDGGSYWWDQETGDGCKHYVGCCEKDGNDVAIFAAHTDDIRYCDHCERLTIWEFSGDTCAHCGELTVDEPNVGKAGE